MHTHIFGNSEELTKINNTGLRLMIAKCAHANIEQKGRLFKLK